MTCFFLVLQTAAFSAENTIIKAGKDELKRSLGELELNGVKPYFISYYILEQNTLTLSASNGFLKKNESNSSRILDIDLRVGGYEFDNTHIIRGNPFSFSSQVSAIPFPLDDNYDAMRSVLWYSTDNAFKNAVERYEKALTNQAVKIAEEDSSDDMSHEKPQLFSEAAEAMKIDTAKFESMVKRLSAIFENSPFILQSEVALSIESPVKYIMNSEGTEVKYGQNFIRLFIYGKTKSEDGMSLPLYKSYFMRKPESFPSVESIEEDIRNLISLLERLRKAPVMETYTGPCILSGEAAGVFFHEIFGHRVEGHREKDPNSSQTFKKSVGNRIFPDFISVTFDPYLESLAGKELAGYYHVDDEGVRPEKVTAVEKGVFNGFLMSRIPIDGFPRSNGHGRKQAGYAPVSRQSNLVVNSSSTISDEKLRDSLIAECRKQDKPYGLLFDVVQGGFTFTARTIPNAFNVQPLVVYKIYTDGRPDELVRGVDLIGTPLTTFSKIIAASDEISVFNGVCGAESGGVPVSASAPSLLISSIEVQKKKKSQARLPLLPPPTGEKNAN